MGESLSRSFGTLNCFCTTSATALRASVCYFFFASFYLFRSHLPVERVRVVRSRGQVPPRVGQQETRTLSPRARGSRAQRRARVRSTCGSCAVRFGTRSARRRENEEHPRHERHVRPARNHASVVHLHINVRANKGLLHARTSLRGARVRRRVAVPLRGCGRKVICGRVLSTRSKMSTPRVCSYDADDGFERGSARDTARVARRSIAVTAGSGCDLHNPAHRALSRLLYRFFFASRTDEVHTIFQSCFGPLTHAHNSMHRAQRCGSAESASLAVSRQARCR